MLKSALLLTAGIAIGAGSYAYADMTERDLMQPIHGGKFAVNTSGPPVYSVSEINVMDDKVDAYNKALPEVQKVIKENTGQYLAGGFNKTKLIAGKNAVSNRYVIIKWDSEADFTKALNGGIRTWLEKNAPDARLVMSEGIAQQ